MSTHNLIVRAQSASLTAALSLSVALALTPLTPASPALLWGDAGWPSWTPQRTDSRYGRAVLELLDPSRLRGRVQEEAVADLVKLGPESIPVLFSFLAGTLEGPAPEYDDAGPGADGPNPYTSDPLRDDVVVLDALKRLPSDEVTARVAAAITGKATLNVRLVGMHVLSEVGGARAVEVWLDSAGGIEDIHLQRAYVQGPVEGALASLLQRDASGFAPLSQVAKSVDRKLAPAIVRAVSAAGRGQGVDVLLSMLGRDRELDLVLLPEIAALTEASLGTLPDEKLSWIRPFLGDEDWRVRRAAAVALGRVQDFRSYGELIACLSDEQRLVGQSALWSLERMSKASLGEKAGDWQRWFEAEIRWLESKGARLVANLEDEDSARVLEAVRELCQHRLFRHETAQAISRLLNNREPSLVSGVCAALSQLESMRAAPALVDALDNPDESARSAAWAALCKLTGRALPLDASTWSHAIRG